MEGGEGGGRRETNIQISTESWEAPWEDKYGISIIFSKYRSIVPFATAMIHCLANPSEFSFVFFPNWVEGRDGGNKKNIPDFFSSEFGSEKFGEEDFLESCGSNN
jgi:hypothetical protein